jgi:tetratricopeptide (TPR) repeat protein
MSDRTDDALDLQLDAKDFRASGQLKEAEESLAKAIKLLTEDLLIKESSFPIGSKSVNDVAAQLADCFGSLGGVLRRDGRIADALFNYGEGKKIEENQMYQIANTYNRVQWTVNRLLSKPELIDEKSMIEGMRNTLDRMGKPQAGGEGGAWRWADILLLAVLVGDERSAREAITALRIPSTLKDVYTSGLPVLSQLLEAMEKLPLSNQELRPVCSRLKIIINEYNDALKTYPAST